MNSELKNGLKSLLDRMAQDPRTGLMFEADGDTLREAINACDQLTAALAERDELVGVMDKQSTILTATANALKGTPAALCHHSHHDLAKVAAKLVAERDEARERVKELEQWEKFVCPTCHGIGEITVTSGQTPESYSQENIPCPDCIGPILEEHAAQLNTAWQQSAEAFREAAAKNIQGACTIPAHQIIYDAIANDLVRALPVPERKEG